MTLRTYVIRRILIAIPTLIAISAITFTIIHLAPGGPFQVFLAMNPRTPGWQIELLRKRYGLDKPILVQYIIWLKMLFSGNLGFSFISGQPVKMMIGSRVINTLKLMITSEIIALITAIPLGVISAVKKNSIIDNFCRVTAFLGVSMPTFWFAFVLLMIFGVKLHWLPIGGVMTPGMEYAPFFARVLDQIKYFILPVVVLSLYSMGSWMRYARSSMLEVIRQDYVRTARAKGLPERVVIYRHALRNALIPIVTLLGLALPSLISGAMITETVFSIPGMGRLTLQAMLNNDYPLAMVCLLLQSYLLIFGNLVADIIYAVVDPRIKYT